MDKSKKKKKKGNKKKKQNIPEISWKEGLLAYQITFREKQLEELKFEVKLLEDQNIRHKERNEQLKIDQQKLISNLLKASHDPVTAVQDVSPSKADASKIPTPSSAFKRSSLGSGLSKNGRGLSSATGGKAEGAEGVDRHSQVGSDVVRVIRERSVMTSDKFFKEIVQNREENERCMEQLKEIQSEIERKEEEIKRIKEKIAYWIDYRDRGQYEEVKQMEIIRQDNVELQAEFHVMADMLRAAMVGASEEQKRKVEDVLEHQKYYATKRAVAQMDKYSRRSVIDNDWLKKEKSAHDVELKSIAAEVDELEQVNLELMSKLFECQQKNLHVPRSMFLAQTGEEEEDDDSADGHDLTQIDLSRLNFDLSSRLSFAKTTSRHKSGERKDIERRFSSHEVSSLSADHKSEESEEEEEMVSGTKIEDGDRGAENRSKDLCLFNAFSDEFLRLGPVEMKTLSVIGESVKLIKLPALNKAELKVLPCRTDAWPVTREMIVHALNKAARRSANYVESSV